MELSMSLGYMKKQRGTQTPRSLEAAARLCAEAGFAYADYTPDYISPDWERKAHEDRAILDALGIQVEQSHAPYNRYGTYDRELFPEYFARSFEAARIVGAKYVAVHADEYRTTDHYDPKEIEDFAWEYLAPHAEFAAKNNMIMAIENVFEDVVEGCPQIDGKSRFTSRIDELQGIIERFHTPSVACCWDFGHARCAFGDEGMLAAMEQVGKYICCTHVHDNYYGKDLHVMPFLGDVDWESHMVSLKKLGYQGKLSFEFVYGRLPDPLLPVWLSSVRAVGEYLIGLFEGKEGHNA